jgi:hypothetical protein
MARRLSFLTLIEMAGSVSAIPNLFQIGSTTKLSFSSQIPDKTRLGLEYGERFQ